MKSELCSFSSLISAYELDRPVDWDVQFARHAPIEVEIGFGMGETLMRLAQRRPQHNFIGIEQHWERICKTLRAMTKAHSTDPSAFKNIRVMKIDARVAFERLFTSRSIDALYCLFPCPWPKKKHIKHRLFDRAFLRLVNDRLKAGGELTIVTDFSPYREWILEQVPGTGFTAKTRTVQPQFDTKFERKWLEEGQKEFFEIDLRKTKHIRTPVKRDTVLKSYSLKQFHARQLRLKDVKGKPSIIFKDVLYDADRQQAMVHALIAEEHLMQHFWVTILKKQNVWKVARADGQNFIPTPGIAKALALVYQAAKDTAS